MLPADEPPLHNWDLSIYIYQNLSFRILQSTHPLHFAMASANAAVAEDIVRSAFRYAALVLTSYIDVGGYIQAE